MRAGGKERGGAVRSGAGSVPGGVEGRLPMCGCVVARSLCSTVNQTNIGQERATNGEREKANRGESASKRPTEARRGAGRCNRCVSGPGGGFWKRPGKARGASDLETRFFKKTNLLRVFLEIQYSTNKSSRGSRGTNNKWDGPMMGRCMGWESPGPPIPCSELIIPSPRRRRKLTE